ncbi:hypothetical protein COCSUDRAFT_48078 [Coccomyxa subellipsoidea C-169]|uniref:RRM domain-containing protein n=1 Tax=Coccomyxa subellipsoidea (strain C-169) TaxID=574566 RepID=I0YSJ5_COCSC|nr:hypothetical protein COCSUDRAFT_48078 [Coccomyxa subellipsoidea C-169]EIE21364.1 hypothetical protein COCSUDRAFT_48078 [Coccomyxa subellipsoidea C-169]|eukprot:XP_005645908.1 hypothetical protein COCSUDRAFT_48078 [Coccomyxa subellipsoidea C-169]
MAEKDNAAELLEQHPDDADDLEPQDEDQLEEHQGEDGSGDQWDLGQEADADFGVESQDEEMNGDGEGEEIDYPEDGAGDQAELAGASQEEAEQVEADANCTEETGKDADQEQHKEAATQNGDAQKEFRTPQKAKRQSEPSPPQEWELFGEIPPRMLPSPLIKVVNVPGKSVPDINEDSLRTLLEAQGLSVHSIAFDSPGGSDTKRFAYVRLTPQPPPWLAKSEPAAEEAAKEPEGEEEKKEGDEEKGRSSRKRSRGNGFGGSGGQSIESLAEAAVRKLNAVEPKLELAGQTLQFIAHREQVTLFIGNLTEEWQDVDRLEKDLGQHGQVERAFIAYNAQGESKNYGIVEFAVPYMALKAKRALDDVEASMRPDTSRRAEREAGGRVEQVKLLRSEFAAIKSVQSQFSRTLFVSNLPQKYKDVRELRSIFEEFGGISDINIPVNQMTQQSRGFAFVEYKRSAYADAAYRFFCANPEHKTLGKLLTAGGPAVAAGRSTVAAAAGGSIVAAAAAGRAAGLAAGRAAGSAARWAAVAGRHSALDRAALGALWVARACVEMQQIQMQRQVQAQVQRQMQAQQATLQAQLRAAQQAAQQAQQQAEQFQRAATQAQAKAAVEAEARKRAEDEARRAAARIRSPGSTSTAYKRQPPVLKGGRGGGRMGAGNAAGFQAGMDTAGAATAAGGYGADASAAATYGPQAGYGDVTGQAAAGYGDASQGAAAAAYAAQASQGYGQAAYGAQTSYGDQSGYAAYGADKQDPATAAAYAGYQGYGQTADASGYGQGAADASNYGNYTSGYGTTTSTGYGQDAAAASAAYSGYGATAATGASAGYGSQGYDASGGYGSAAYGAQGGGYGQQAAGYGTEQATGGGYGAQAGYGQQANYGQQPAQADYGAVGQKRDASGYDAATAAQYGYGGVYGAQTGGNNAKRSRF